MSEVSHFFWDNPIYLFISGLNKPRSIYVTETVRAAAAAFEFISFCFPRTRERRAIWYSFPWLERDIVKD